MPGCWAAEVWALENVIARISLEAGGRVTTNCWCAARILSDLISKTTGGSKWLLANDTTVVSALRVHGTARRRAATHDRVATAKA